MKIETENKSEIAEEKYQIFLTISKAVSVEYYDKQAASMRQEPSMSIHTDKQLRIYM